MSTSTSSSAPVPPPAWLDRLLEKNLLPDALIRLGIRRLLRARLRAENRGGAAAQQAQLLAMQFQFDRSQWWSPQAIQAAQDRQLDVLLAHAGRTVPFYRRRWRAAGIDPDRVSAQDFAALPDELGDLLFQVVRQGLKIRVLGLIGFRAHRWRPPA